MEELCVFVDKAGNPNLKGYEGEDSNSYFQVE